MLAVGSLAIGFARPYRVHRDEQARAFAAWFWESLGNDAELACARSDLGIVVDPTHWQLHWTEYYLCYQAIYSSRHRQKAPLDLTRVTASRPLRCVFFNEHPERDPAVRVWIARMNEQFAPLMPATPP